MVIEAVQFTQDMADMMEPWPEGVQPYEHPCKPIPMCETLEGNMKVSVGDWVITGVKGEKYPCKPDIFEATYERVED